MEIKKTVLAVDDSPVSLQILASFLSAEYRPMIAKSAAEAITLMSKTRPDLILLDIEMPDVSGFEFLHTIKKNPKSMNVPVIIVSSHSDEQFVIHSKNAGASDIIPKPVNKEELLQKIKRALENPPKNIFGL